MQSKTCEYFSNRYAHQQRWVGIFRTAFISLFLFCMVHGASSSAGLAGTPINIGAGIDLIFALPFDDTGDSEFEVRAFELNIGAPVDPFFDMLATLSWHEGEFDLEEAWASAVLPGGFKVLLGREFIPFGYLNRIHEHDFPQADQPFVIEGLTTDHGFIGDGGHIEYLAPFINPTLTINVGIYNNIQHSIGRRIDGFPVLGRIQSYMQSGDGTHSLLMGASYLSSIGSKDPMSGRLDGDGKTSDRRARGKINYAAGFDLKYKWTPVGQTYRGLTLGGEYLFFDYDAYENHVDYEPGLDAGDDQGFYAYLEWDFNRFWGIGYRYDNTDILFSSILDDARINAHSIYGQWRPTEFSRLRFQYQYLNDDREADAEHHLMVQSTFFIGWHPPHRF